MYTILKYTWYYISKW